MEQPIPVANIYPLKFYTKYTHDSAGNVKKAEDWCMWAKKGVRTPVQIPQQISIIQKDPAKWNVIKPYYQQWKEGRQLEAQGTSLDAWPHLNSEERDMIRQVRCFTLEDFANMSDAMISEIPFPDVRKKRDAAKNFIRYRDEQETVSELHQRIKDLEAQVNAKAANTDSPDYAYVIMEKSEQDDEKNQLRKKLKDLNVKVGPNTSLKKLRQMVAEAAR